ncbi:preprotein translocase subunit SecY [Xylocopilactobacillus apis]|uniref:Protein translocase subunit SecY n=1 Tax=Xylocopilactobacillus apis TaxID=2932183 RepID=A0AAU9D445_9LACO|nr:preprotein translocase subunit SecY [Xylocopilactobacillus apis]BDR57251.1 protein translocase subunit SecY [Xylocopilactobacillus apis]
MFKTLFRGLKVKNIRSRILFTFFAFLIYRFGSLLTVPGVNAKAMTSIAQSGLVPILDTVSGGGLANYSIFALGVSPYITAQIVVQLLQMDIVPVFVEWSKQGEVGRRKLNNVTRVLTIVLAFLQSVAITGGFNALSTLNNNGQKLVKVPTVNTFIEIGFILTAGTMFLTWLGEQITDKGLGNGVSMIIAGGIISRLPSGIMGLYHQFIVGASNTRLMINIGLIVLIVVAVILITTFVTYVQQANYKIPIQFTRRATGTGDNSFLPLKINVSGVIPVIFASSFIVTPQTILTAFRNAHGEDTWFKVLDSIFNLQSNWGVAIYTILIVLFTFFYAFVQVNPEKVAENLTKQGSYIPGVRPGEETEDYISKLLIRLSTVGSVFLGLISLVPLLASNIWGLPQSIGLGGTSLLIIVGVALETTRQLDGLLMKREYVGFIR